MASLDPPGRGDLITSADLADWLATPSKTLADWRATRTGPPFYRIGTQVRYSRAEIADWLAARRVATA